MRLRRLRTHWSEFGRRDPLGAVLTSPDKKGNQWSVDEFLQTGCADIAAVMTYLDTLSILVPRRPALHFGCGAGRLTRALAACFDDVIGPDIAASMVAVARELHPDVEPMLPLPLVAVVRRARKAVAPFPRMDVHGLPRHDVEDLRARLGGTVVDVVDDRSHGADTPGYRYRVRKVRQ